jgi:hypothetical protein
MAENDNVQYDVPMIPQCRKDACWYAAAQMIVRWGRDNKPKAEVFTANPEGGGLIDTPEMTKVTCDPTTKLEMKTEDAKQIKMFAREFNLRWSPVDEFTRQRIRTMLLYNGPLWYSGKFEGADPSDEGHAVAIIGILHNTLVVNDPWGDGSKLYPGFDSFFKAIVGVSGVPVLHYY